MQDKSFDKLILSAFNGDMKPKKVSTVLKQIANENALALPKEMPDYLRIPDAEELRQMRDYAISLRKNNKKLSKRQVRKSVQEKFHCKIYK